MFAEPPNPPERVVSPVAASFQPLRDEQRDLSSTRNICLRSCRVLGYVMMLWLVRLRVVLVIFKWNSMSTY